MNRITSVIAIALAAILFAGCSGYNKLLKSGDPELMYQKALEFYGQKKYQKTLQLLDEIAHVYSGQLRADTIAYYTATCHYKQGDFETSGMLFDNFRREYGRSPFIEDAEYMYAKGFYFMSPAPERDQTVTQQALVAINEYLARYPKSVKKEMLEENIIELKQKLYDKSYINAKTYFNIGRYKSAVVALKNALQQYPETNHREELMYLIAKSSYLLASNSLEKLQRDRYMDMMDTYYTFASEFPNSKHRKELEKILVVAKDYLEKYHDTNEDTITTPAQPDAQNKENK